ncbi:MAG: WXG100 family type VII secretion target [Mogibacterium sp.]|nr:WXG100 family type VII secretion target [Mogibacterium sp.]
MADWIKVNTNRLKSDASDIENYIQAIRNRITDLRAHSATLDAMWDGPSSEAFKMAFLSDIEALEAIMASLDAMNEYEDVARQKYDECESKVADLVNQVHVG